MQRVSSPFSLLAVLLLVALTTPLATGCSDDDPDEIAEDVDAGDFNDADGDAPDSEDAGDSATGDLDEEDADRPPPGEGDNDWEWDEDFSVQAISPARGPLAGGTQVQIAGTGLNSNTTVLFGSTSVEVTTSQGQLLVKSPPADSAGPVTVRVISGDGETIDVENGFTYSNGLSVSSASPDRIPTTGGVEITLHGNGFVDAMGVSFSGTPARRVDVINNQLARVIAPSHSRGRADLRVSIPDEAVVLEDGIYFFRPLSVDSVTPAAGSIHGGDTVVLKGEGFTSSTDVFFGDEEATIVSLNVGAGELVVLTPPAATEGPADIFLENSDDVLRLRNAFYYDQEPDNALYSIYPGRAPTSGDSEHVVAGRGLDGSDAVLFLDGQQVTILDSGPGHALIETPSVDNPGAVDLDFERGGQHVASLPDALLYELRPIISEVEPASGSAAGGETVHIYGEDLSDVNSVSFGGLPASFEVIDDGHITATTPRSEAGAVDVRLESGTQQAALENGYTFSAPLEIWSMRPSRGAIAGGTHVTVQGRGFTGLIEVDIGGESATNIRRIDPYTITFRTPPSNAGPREVTISAVGMEENTPYPFVYFNPLSSFGGASGAPVDGAVNVSVVTVDGTPIPGAFVMLSTQADTPFRGFTDANGQIVLSGPGVLGSQMVTATAANFSSFTVRHIDAENITIVLNPIEADGGGGQGSPPPIGRISGEITITGKSEDPAGGTDYNMSMIRTTRNHLFGGTRNPGPDSVVAGEGPFSISTRIGDMALIGLCGIYDADTDTFTPKLMAVERYLFLSDQDHQRVDLECDIPLDKSLPIKLVDPVYAPTGPTINEASAFLDFGFEGVFRIPDAARGVSDVLVVEGLPAAEDALHDITYSVVAGSYNGAGTPYTQTTMEGITDLERFHSTRPLVGVPELLSPAPGGVADGQIQLGLKGVNSPDFFYIILRNAIGLPVWSFVVPGYERIIPLPEFPTFDELSPDDRPEPFQPGTLYGVAYGLNIDGFDYHGFTNRDFASSRWSGFSVATWQMRLAD